MEKKVKYSFFHKNNKHELVQDYFQLRTEVFREYWELDNFSGEEDEFDNDAHILVIHKNNVCVGGARLVLHLPGSSNLLPIETDSFKMVRLFPDFNLETNIYSELSRVVLSKEYRTGEYSAFLYHMIGEKARSLNVKYVFACAPLCQARMSKIACRKVGINLEIKSEIDVPELPTYEGNKMYLSITDLTNTHSTKYQEHLQIKDTV
ncbi:MAG: GNAT family N-acetyltransferase [Rickettsiales bacterium]|nr:GNAT family N-acetyltransferase [Pseudomonadota bacterium]MDA0966185.1 GNAT family N-acetyltransferase [Pseudomonadota bacterium]MDG4543150.1 GNAT family N-acetyltransferase [Rickettsiales bacterium]MDG4545348.1 GNAT family N-acetyltransferase [Rickettsiales bacterium]MDG4547797.1 GNAT family N-acetyltransferase [Rickettsiales bacterium]